MGRLDGKVAIITGAAGGQGKAAVEMFLHEGCRVIACDIISDCQFSIKEEMKDSFEYVSADLTKESDVHGVVQLAIRKYGKIDTLYNNHGIMIAKPFLENTMQDFDHINDVNLRSVFMLCLYAAQEMVKTGGGSIINVSSGGGLVGFPNMSAYGAAKGGVVNLSRALAVDLAPYNIRVNAICPGIIDTPMPRRYVEKLKNKEHVWNSLPEVNLLKRLGKPEEIVWFAIYLASDESSFMTGSVIPIDGGETAH
jgi:2-keto-3-deoxy-L-fuconate dehydrogenase